MPSAPQVEICVITRTYQGLEGTRVHAGTRFAVGKPKGDLTVITKQRYEQLRYNRLARPLDEKEDAGALPRARYAPDPTKVEQTDGSGTSVRVARQVRQSARMRSRQVEEPPPPKELKAPAARTGSPTGKEALQSSLQAGQASSSSTLTSRGRRSPR